MSDPRRRLPPVNALLAEAKDAGLGDSATRGELVIAIRGVLDAARHGAGEAPSGGWLAAIEQRLSDAARLSLRPVINATGVILHTNLGRAPLAESARRAAFAALGYSSLELDMEDGGRGSRQQHTRSLLREITGAEDSLVVNNAASAVLLVLNALAERGETIVSRGELVEIGGAFRIPEILAKSGSVLLEVGTTNRTRLRDYELAVSPRTRLLLKVHRSNFRLTGFVADVEVADLVALGQRREIPVAHDIGSGLLIRLDDHGLSSEPLVQDSVSAGAIAIFSGDKLVGGPQAGIIVGPTAHLTAISSSPLARALRPDKTAFAALEATLLLYRDPARAICEIPVLRMLTATAQDLRRRARRLRRLIPAAQLAPGASTVGGGAFPDVELPTLLVTVEVRSCDTLLAALRRHDPPIIARATEQQVVLDPRTIDDGEVGAVGRAVASALEQAS